MNFIFPIFLSLFHFLLLFSFTMSSLYILSESFDIFIYSFFLLPFSFFYLLHFLYFIYIFILSFAFFFLSSHVIFLSLAYFLFLQLFFPFINFLKFSLITRPTNTTETFWIRIIKCNILGEDLRSVQNKCLSSDVIRLQM